MQNALIAVAGIAAAMGPLSIVTSKAIVAVQGLAKAYAWLTLSAGAASLATLGVGLALAGIAAGVLWIQSVRQSFRDMAQAATNDMGKAVNQLALFEEGEKEVALNAYRATVGVKKLTQATTGMNDAEFGQALIKQSKAAHEELERLSTLSGVTRERIVQLADSLGINLANATDEQRESLAAAIAEVSRSITPTERLADAQQTLGNAAATTAEQFDAFKEALDAALGVQLSAEESTIKYHDRIAKLAEALAEHGTKTGFATEHQRELEQRAARRGCVRRRRGRGARSVRAYRGGCRLAEAGSYRPASGPEGAVPRAGRQDRRVHRAHQTDSDRRERPTSP